VRATAAYEAVFADPEPLVSVVIPTFDSTRLLLERSLPSVLGQTYERLEVIVMGDAAAPGVGAAVAAAGDDRVHYANLPYRIPDPDQRRHWLAGSVAARNAGMDRAAGAWVVEFDDDDALRPAAIERALDLARRERLEVTYGAVAYHRPDGTIETMATYPPELGRFATQGALVHSGLRFFDRTPAAAIFDVPNDWFRIEAMLRAGVRFGMHDEVVVDYHPSMRGGPATKTPG
jgi:glycosyltransferase involved in cell wall biosynthesis